MRLTVILTLIFVSLAKLHAQPPDERIPVDTISFGDTIVFADSVIQYVAEFHFPNGKEMTVHGVTNRIEASSRSASGTRIFIKEIIAVNSKGEKVRLKK